MLIKNIKTYIILAFFLFVYAISLQAQGKNSVSGIVVDIDGRPIEMVNVLVTDDFTQVVTNSQGEFSISTNIGKSLYFSKKGYKPINLVVNTLTGNKVQLSLESDEKVYEVAYGKRAKSSLTASIARVSSEDIAKVPVSTLGNAIQGLATGLTVLRSVGAEPGWDQPSIYIRGVQTFGGGTAPLVMVDNVERDFTQLDPEEIESLTVLKDAAATALYGMRGANGVILVTTKRGFIGKPVITLTAQTGYQSATRLPQYAGSQDYVKYRNIALRNDYSKLSDNDFNQLFLSNPKSNPANYDGTNPYLYPNTNWHDSFIKSSAPQQSYNFSFRGGSEIAQYYLMLGVLSQDGLYNYGEENDGFSTQNRFSRYNVRTAVDVSLSKDLKIGVNIGGRVENRHTPGTSAGSFMTALSKLPPTIPVFNENGSLAGSSTYQYNPYGMIANSGFQDRFNRNIQGTVTGDLKLSKLLDGLSANVLFGFDASKLFARTKDQNYAVYQQNVDNTYTKFGEGSSITLGYGTWGTDFTLMLNYKFGFAYDKVFDKNHLQADVNYMQSSLTTDGNNPDYRNQGVFGRTTYTYDKRLSAEFGFAYNGSENFAKGKRFGFFPTASVAWTVSNEDFLLGNNTISYLKLRGSYGKVGNSNIGIGYRYPFEENYYGGGGYYFGNSNSDGATEGRIPNPNIMWEESLNANIGIEIGLFKSLLFEVDLFNHDRSKIITGLWNTLPSFIGQDVPYANDGSVLTRGFEMSLKHEKTFSKFGYTIQGTVSYAHNKISSMAEVAGMNSWEYRTGQTVNQQWGLQVSDDKFFANQADIDNWAKSSFGSVQPGDVKYVDQNEDNVIDGQDNVPLGKSFVPEWNFGLNLGCRYKGFDFNALLTGIANRSVFVSNNVLWGMQDNNKITLEAAQNSWGISDNPTYPRLTTLSNPHNYRASSLWLKNVDFLRIQNVEIGYSLPKSLLKNAKITDMRIYVNGYNLFSFDSMSKYNLSAEIPNAGVTLYPETRIVNFGVKITL